MTYEDLIEHFGGCTAAAGALGRSKQTVNNWKDSGIPEIEQLEIQKKTQGVLRADPAIIRKFRSLLGERAA